MSDPTAEEQRKNANIGFFVGLIVMSTAIGFLTRTAIGWLTFGVIVALDAWREYELLRKAGPKS